MRRTAPLLTLMGLALLLAAQPDLQRRLETLVFPGRTLAVASSEAEPPLQDPALRPLALLEGGLMERLAEADRAWIPRAEPLPEGGTRYLYRRRPGDPDLTLSQIRARIANPPSHAAERRAITALLMTLERVGVGVGLIEPIRAGAAAEWDPRARTLRIRPDVPDQGSVEFARVLNHEAIHVAQSCAAGGVGAMPRPLMSWPLGAIAAGDGDTSGQRGAGGAALQAGPGDPAALRQLQDPLYADLNPQERRMESEAYLLQNRPGLGEQLVRIHCLEGKAA